MNFTSPTFLLYFLPFLLIIYLISPERFKNIILILASALFYFWGEKQFLLYLYAWVVINYITSFLIYKSKKHPGFYLTAAIFINLSILFYFKYTNFLILNLNYLGFTTEQLKIHLPLALSFFTFHAISYNIDTYRKLVKPESSLSRIILYFTFFPHLIAGPIIRYHQIEDQLVKRDVRSWMISQGLFRFFVGLAKKVIIANTLAPIADEIFGIGPMHVSFDQAWLGVLCFGLQIYYDFSGYTDMAIGLGLIFGFKFPENFNYPYISTSITDFWRRWHITLSSWIRDYLFYPLALRSGISKTKLYISMLATFMLVGLWHGANWTFVAFGAIQGILLILERIRNGVLFKWMPQGVKHAYFLLAISISWVFFRSADLLEGFKFSVLILTNHLTQGAIYYSTNYFLRIDIFIVIIAGIFFATPTPKLIFNSLLKVSLFKFVNIKFLNAVVLTVLFLTCLVFISGESYKSFVYFRF